MSTSNTKPQVLKITASTWTRDSHGLFDYETSGYSYGTIYLDDKSQIYRQILDGKIVDSKEINYNPNADTELLITVNKKNDGYTIANVLPNKVYPSTDCIKELQQKVWYIINSDDNDTDTNEDYCLNLFDIIKLGRVNYVITEYHISRPSVPEPKENSYNIGYENWKHGSIFDMIYKADRYEESKGEDKLCKICYSSDNDDANPLVHLCACTGGIRFAHFQCLKLWMQTKLTIKENMEHNSKSYLLNGFNCEICQTPYPCKINSHLFYLVQFVIGDKPKVFGLVDIKRPLGEYIILESLNQIKEKINMKIIHVIQLNQEQYIIGRGHECDVRINDISVSRVHATLYYNKSTKKIMLKDLKSKFGTLVLIKSPLNITHTNVHLQVGRTVFETHLVPMNVDNNVPSKVKIESKKTNDIEYPQDNPGNIKEKDSNKDIVNTKNNQLNNSDKANDLFN